MRKHKWMKVIALCLCMVMLLTCLPVSTFAGADAADTVAKTEQISTDIAQTDSQTTTNDTDNDAVSADASAAADNTAAASGVSEDKSSASDTIIGQVETGTDTASDPASEITDADKASVTDTNGSDTAKDAKDTSAANTDTVSKDTAANDTTGQDTSIFQKEMKFSTLRSYAKRSPKLANESKTTSVKIEKDGVQEDGTIKVGAITEETAPSYAGMQYEGAFVVTTDSEGNVINEDEIKYTGTYTNSEGTYVYYAFSESPSTGILLADNQYIKLVYKSVCSVTYEVRQDSVDGAILNTDGSLNGENVKSGSGGGFVSAASKVDKNTILNLQFKEEKNAKNSGKDYELVGVYQIAADGTKTEITMDGDNTASIKANSSEIKIVAVVKPVEQYKLIVTNTSSGHVCWAGNSSENNSNTSDPYSVEPSKFCSYDADGSVTGTKGATVTAAPDGTIYWVMYSQTGSKWQLQHLIINDVYVNATCDGKVHNTELGNGMVAHFQYLGDEKKDSHLKDNSKKERSKFACWVTNVSSDVEVNFECESERRETLTLIKADGIAQVVASTYDLSNKADYWDGIYNGDNGQKQHAGQKFPNRTLTGDDIGKDLINEAWTGSDYWLVGKSGARSSDNGHSSIEYKHSSSGYGTEYIYLKVKDGYDPNTLTASITGQDDPLYVDSIANAASKDTSHFFGLIKNTRNKALKTARNEGYQWFTSYDGVGQYFRQLSLSASPYQYSVVYDLDGGNINGETTVTDSNKYTIESGNNRIIMPATTPVKEGYVFQGWKLVPTNQKYAGATNLVLDANGKFTIDSTTYDYGLETEKTTYELDGTTYTDWNAVSGGNHQFKFVAQWAEEDDPTSVKANYTITSYKEVPQSVYDTLDTAKRTTKDGKYYQQVGETATYVGTVGQTIVGIPAEADSGYVLSDKSITELKNFKKDGNTATQLIYYYDVQHTLTVTKALEGEYADKTKAFSVTITLNDANGNPVSGTYACTGSDASIWGGASGETSGTITFTNGTAQISLKGDQSITISGLMTGSYGVSEAGDSNYTVKYSVDNGTASETAVSGQALNYTLNANGGIDNVASTVTITNTRDVNPPTGLNSGYSVRGLFAAAGVIFAGVLVTIVMRRSNRRSHRFGGGRR